MVALATLPINEFCSLAKTPEFYNTLRADFIHHYSDSTLSEAEWRSWVGSLPELASLIERLDPMPQGHILIEYPMPLGSMRADCVLIGANEERVEVIVIELKQWTQGSVGVWNSLGVDWLKVFGSDPYTTNHPCEQVDVYKNTLKQVLDFGRVPVHITALAFLHNYEEALEGEVLRLPTYHKHLENAVLLTKTQGADEAAQVLSRLKRPTPRVDLFTSPRLKYSDSFIINFSNELNCSALFKATKQQVEAFKKIAPFVQRIETKTCVVVRGLVGTGKTVLAMKLVQYLMELGKNPLYYVKSAAIGQCIKGLSFAVGGQASTDYLVIDEAHRLEISLALSFMRNKKLIVFFIDDDQWISPGETCRSVDVEEHARRQGFTVINHTLDEQLRCTGAERYVQWARELMIDSRLQPYQPTEKFSVEVAQTPEEMEQALRDKVQENSTSRIVAGYCWKWVTENTPGRNTDITIGNWHARWNKKRAFKEWNQALGYHEEVGAIYTVQGFEYDYVGVIFGPDIILRNGSIQIVVQGNADKKLTGRNVLSSVQDQVIRNIYYVLMTRAKKGVILYAVDPELQSFLLTEVQPLMMT